MVKKIILTCSISYNGYIIEDNGSACKTMKQVKEHGLVKLMYGGIENSDRQAIIDQIYLFLLLIPSQHQLISKCQDMVDGTLKQRCYHDVWYAMGNSDININAVKAKVTIFISRDYFCMELMMGLYSLIISDQQVSILKISKSGKIMRI